MTLEVAHDERLLELLRDLSRAEYWVDAYRGTIQSVTDPRPHNQRYASGRRVPDPRPFSEALETLKAEITKGESYDGKYAWPKYLEHYEGAVETKRLAGVAVHEHEASYTGWQRFWLVTSSPGHIHSSRNCSSCKVTTTYALVPKLSASTAEAAIEMFGPAMCSVCFPDAPTGLKVSKALAESVGTEGFAKALAKHQAKAGIA